MQALPRSLTSADVALTSFNASAVLRIVLVTALSSIATSPAVVGDVVAAEYGVVGVFESLSPFVRPAGS